MCDEYDDERMTVFWRRLEQLDQRERLAPETEESPDSLMKAEPFLVAKTKPRVLTH